MNRLFTETRQAATLVLVMIMAFFILPQTAYAVDPTASPIINSIDSTNTYQAEDSRTGMLNTIQIDAVNTGNYQINDVVTLSDGYLYLGFDNMTGIEMVRKINFEGMFVWQNTSFSDLPGTTQIRSAVEINNRLFITGYARDPVTRITTGFICELNPSTGALIPDSISNFSGRSNGAVSDGVGFIYIAGSEGLHSYDIATKTITTANPATYHYSLAYVSADHSVVAVCGGASSNTLVKYSSPTSSGVLSDATAFFTPASTDYIWSIYSINGFLYTVGQEADSYVGKFTINGTNLGRQSITSEILDSSVLDYHTYSLFSNLSSVFFDPAKNKIYFLGSSNYPNRNGNPTDPTSPYFTPFNTLCFYEFNAGTDVVANEYVKVWSLLDLNLHSTRNIHINAAGNLIVCGTTQSGNVSGDTTNRMFYLTAGFANTIDTAPTITSPKTIISYTNMTDTTGLITNTNLKGLMTFADDRTSTSNVAASFKLNADVPTTGTGTSDIYYSVTDQCGNKTIGKVTLIRKTQITGLVVTGSDSVNKTSSAMPTASYTVEYMPSTATDQGVTWSSSAHDVATIDSATGELTTVGFGSTIITAQSISNPAISATKTVTVKNLYDVTASPANGATDVAVNGTISITFEEAMNTTPGIVSLNGSVIAGTGSWSGDSKTYTIPYAGLSYGTLYTIKVENFRDSSGDWIITNQSNSFTTLSAVKAAKAAAEAEVYTALAQAAATDETAIQTYIASIACAAINNIDISVTVNKLTYTEAIAGTSADAVGTDGAYAFTITVSKGIESETTVEKTLVVTATAYTGVTDINAVAAAKAAVVDGTVDVAFGAAQEAKTAAVQTYVNQLLAAVSDAAGVTAAVSFDSGNTYIVALSKGSVIDSKSIIITVNEAPDPDVAIVTAAKTAVQNAVYAAISQAAATDETTIQAYIKTIANTAIGNSDISVAVNGVTYTGAIAGTSADADGTDGAYAFTITVSKGTISDSTLELTLVVTATAFTGVTDVNAVAAAKAAMAEGEVSVAFGAAQEARTAAVQTYVNQLLAAVSDASGVTATVSFDSGSTYTVILSKGSVLDSVPLIMTVTEAADPDISTVAAAKTAAENAVYAALAQDAATDEGTVRAYIENIAAFAVSDSSVAVTVNKISYTAAVAGTYGNSNGVNGEYVYTCTVSKGSQSQTTLQRTLTIIARKHAFSVTVVKGTGSGSFTAGTIVSILADTAQSGWVFDRWTCSSGVLFANAGSTLTTFVMPESDVTVTAVYRYVGDPGGADSDYIPRTLMPTSGSSDILVSGNSINRNAQLTVSPLAINTTGSDAFNIAIREAKADGRLIAGYDIQLSVGFQGTITLSFPVGAAYNGQIVNILHYINGQVETYTPVVANGVATITVNSLSPFVVLRTGLTVPGSVNPPETGDAVTPLGFIAIGLAAACAFWVVKRRQKA